MVHIFSSHGPLINQLKPARPISAGFLRAFAAAPASTNTTFYAKNAPVTSTSICLNFVQAFLGRYFSAPNLSFRQIELSEFSSELCFPLLPSNSTPCASLEWIHGHCGWEDTATPPPTIPCPRCHMENTGDERFFCSSGARANRSARLFPSPDNEPQPWVRGTTSGDEETVQSTAYLFSNVFDEAAKKGSISAEECWLLHSSARNIHFSLQAGQHPNATNGGTAG